MKGRILVVRGGAIGDFILTLPVLSALRAHLPQSEIHLLAYPQVATLAAVGGLADGVQNIEARALAGFFGRGTELDPDLCQYFEQFALILSFLYDPDGIFQENVARCSRAQFIAGPHRPDETKATAAPRVFLEPLARLAIFDPDPTPRLALPQTLNRWPRPLFAMHPGSGSESKNWPEQNWRLLLNRLVAEKDWDFLLVGGEAEGEKLERLAAVIPEHRRRIARSLPLVDLAKQLIRCDFFIGHDSGITHLAAALGLPGLALWGRSNEEIWRPNSDQIRVIRHPQGLTSLPMETVLAALPKSLGKPSS